MIVRKNNNAIEISFQYDPALISFVKSLEGRKYNPATKLWSIPLAGSHASIDRLAKKGFTIHPDLWAEVRKDQEQAREAEALALLPDTDFTTTLPLFPYQKVGSAFLWKIGSGLLGDDVGLGKTIQALAVIEKSGSKKNLVVCPKVLVYQWQEEIKKFLPNRQNIIVVDGNADSRKKQYQQAKNLEEFILIVGYETMRIDIEELQLF